MPKRVNAKKRTNKRKEETTKETIILNESSSNMSSTSEDEHDAIQILNKNVETYQTLKKNDEAVQTLNIKDENVQMLNKDETAKISNKSQQGIKNDFCSISSLSSKTIPYNPSTYNNSKYDEKALGDDEQPTNPSIHNKLKYDEKACCNDKRSANPCNIYYWVFYFSLGCFIAYVLQFGDSASPVEEPANLNKDEKFRKEFDTIKKDFSMQSKKFWKIIKLELESHLNEETNHHPAVLLLASSKNGEKTMQCIAKRLSYAYSSTCSSYIQINGETYKDKKAESVKSTIDDQISEAFNAGSCAALVSRFDELPPYATTTFYQFCENDNAPFKNVLIIFTVQVEDGTWNRENLDLEQNPENRWDRVVNDYLLSVLHDRDQTSLMTNEMISALLSRITPSVVWVNREETLTQC